MAHATSTRMPIAAPTGAFGQALVMSIDGCSMWRFGDEPDGGVDVSAVRRWKTDVW